MSLLKKFNKLKQFPFFTKNPSDLFYFIGYQGSNGVLVIFSSNDFLLFIDNRYLSEYKEKLGMDVCKIKDQYYLQSIAQEIVSRNNNQLHIDLTEISYAEYQKMESIFKEFSLSIKGIGQDNMKSIRMIKDKEEIVHIKRAQEIVDKALFAIIGNLKEGMSAHDLSNELRFLIYKQGADGIAFENIILFGSDTSYIHGRVNHRKLQYQDVILIDVGAMYKGYCSDMTRTLFFGKADQEFKKHYHAVLETQKTIINMVKEGVKCSFLDKKSREILKEFNLLEYFNHSLGHGVGIDVHEYPQISKNSTDVLKTNIVFTIEPGVYFENQYGIRIEDLVYLNGHNQVEILSQFPKELLEIY